MSKKWLLAVLLITFNLVLQAQAFKISLGPELSNPKGDFNRWHSIGYGASVQLEYMAFARLSFLVSGTYGHWEGDMQVSDNLLKNDTYDLSNLTTSFGVKTPISEYFYASVEIGYYYLYSTTEYKASSDQSWDIEFLRKDDPISKFGQGIALGFEKLISNRLFFDGSVKYCFVPGKYYTYNRIAARFALSYQF